MEIDHITCIECIEMYKNWLYYIDTAYAAMEPMGPHPRMSIFKV